MGESQKTIILYRFGIFIVTIIDLDFFVTQFPCHRLECDVFLVFKWLRLRREAVFQWDPHLCELGLYLAELWAVQLTWSHSVSRLVSLEGGVRGHVKLYRQNISHVNSSWTQNQAQICLWHLSVVQIPKKKKSWVHLGNYIFTSISNNLNLLWEQKDKPNCLFLLLSVLLCRKAHSGASTMSKAEFLGSFQQLKYNNKQLSSCNLMSAAFRVAPHTQFAF